jgi:hypothetical protein
MKTRYFLIIPILIALTACEPQIDEFEPSRGSADFTSYIAFGDSWTAGFADASLYKSGQQYSYPSILAGQFATAGGGEFKQPLMLDDIGVGLATGQPEPKLMLTYKQDCLGTISLVPAYAEAEVNLANLLPIGADGPYNNVGIPALKSVHVLVPGYAGLNPYFGRFASGLQGTVLEEIPGVDASFFTLWIGVYDLIGYAVVGGEGDPPVNVTAFSMAFSATLEALTANGAKGVVANIPDVLDAPFFHTIPYNALVLTEQAQVDALNAGYSFLNQLIKLNGSVDTFHFALGPNPFVIEDLILPWGRRHIKPDELVLLSVPQDSLKCGGWGSADPIPEYYTLNLEEIAAITSAQINYNETISDLVQVSSKPLVLVDMRSALADLKEGLVFDGITLDNRLVQGNFYSLDGLNPTPMGCAVVAHYFIEAINQGFDAAVPQVIVSDYPAVILP